MFTVEMENADRKPLKERFCDMIILIICPSLQHSSNLWSPWLWKLPCHLFFLNILSSLLLKPSIRQKSKYTKKAHSRTFRLRSKGCPKADLQFWALKLKSGQVEILCSSLPFGARYILCCRVSANRSKMTVPSCYYRKSAMALLWSKWQIQQQLFDRDLQKLPCGC